MDRHRKEKFMFKVEKSVKKYMNAKNVRKHLLVCLHDAVSLIIRQVDG